MAGSDSTHYPSVFECLHQVRRGLSCNGTRSNMPGTHHTYVADSGTLLASIPFLCLLPLRFQFLLPIHHGITFLTTWHVRNTQHKPTHASSTVGESSQRSFSPPLVNGKFSSASFRQGRRVEFPSSHRCRTSPLHKAIMPFIRFVTVEYFIADLLLNQVGSNP